MHNEAFNPVSRLVHLHIANFDLANMETMLTLLVQHAYMLRELHVSMNAQESPETKSYLVTLRYWKFYILGMLRISLLPIINMN